MEKTFVVGLVVLLVFIAFKKSRGITLSQFLYNDHSTSQFYTIASSVAGNVGVGTIVGIYTFAYHGPLMALTISVCYVLGMVLTGFLAPTIRTKSQQYRSESVIDFINKSHNIDNPYIVWFSISLVFVLQLSVQILALSQITAGVFGMDAVTAMFCCLIILIVYVFLGGYQSATTTDFPQAIVIVSVSVLVFVFGDLDGVTTEQIFSLGEYSYVLLIGAVIFLGPTVFISVDNWHRVTTADSSESAKRGFIIGGVICLFIYLSYSYLGVTGADAEVSKTIKNVLPSGISWIVSGMLIMAILSTIDTTITPLLSTFNQQNLSLSKSRTIVVVMFLILGLIAISIGDIVTGIVAAFSSIAVFIPPILSGLFGKNLHALAAVVSIPTAVILTIALSFMVQEYAAIVGFIVSLSLYSGVAWVLRKRAG